MKKILWATLVVTGTVLSASATLVVDYNTPSGNVNSRAADSDTAGADTWNYSMSTALIPAGTGGQNGTIYGGMNTTWSDATAYAPFFRHQATAFQLQVNKGVGVDTSAKGLLLWKKEAFLNNGDSQTVNIEAADSFSVNLLTFAGTSRSLRFAIILDGTNYVSNTQTTANGAQTFTVASSNTSWRTVSTDGNYTVGSTPTTLDLKDIDAVGLYWDMARTGNQTAVRFDDFQVDATVVPEPATISLVVIGGGVLSLVLRRVRRKH